MTQEKAHDLNRLLHQSQQLSAKISGTRNIPFIYRGLEQIEAFSSKLAAKTGSISSLNSKYLLFVFFSYILTFALPLFFYIVTFVHLNWLKLILFLLVLILM